MKISRSKYGLMISFLWFGLLAFLSLDSFANEPEEEQTQKQGLASVTEQGEEAEQDVKKKKKEVPKELTAAEKRKICENYKSKYISYYSTIYYVTPKCERQKLAYKEIFELTRINKKITTVTSKVISALSGGENFSSGRKRDKNKTCQQLNGHYVTFNFGDIYYIKRCKKRVFQDWASFEAHRGKLASKNATVISLNWAEMSSIQEGRPMPSDLDQEYGKYVKVGSQVDLIPLDEACEGVNGRYVSYYSTLYKIEKCRKRKIIDIAKFSIEIAQKNIKVKELTSEQWLSIPDGQPF